MRSKCVSSSACRTRSAKRRPSSGSRRTEAPPSRTLPGHGSTLEKAIHQGLENDDRVARLDTLRERFEAQEGHVEREYWAENSAMGVVLTAKPRRRSLRMLGLSPRYALHRSTESASLPYELEAALADGDTLAAKAALVLNGGAAATVLSRIFEAHKFLLSVVDAEMRVDPNHRARYGVRIARGGAGRRRLARDYNRSLDGRGQLAGDGDPDSLLPEHDRELPTADRARREGLQPLGSPSCSDPDHVELIASVWAWLLACCSCSASRPRLSTTHHSTLTRSPPRSAAPSPARSVHARV